ncbi:hypothetical protein BDW02DRAFT_571380, partial [Decorospora gaudefroyi]
MSACSRPTRNASDSSSEMESLIQVITSELVSWQGESPPTHTSTHSKASNTANVPRKTRFLERFDTVKLTEKNLTALETTQARHNQQDPSRLIDRQYRFDPPSGVTAYQVRRKPLSDSAREAVQSHKEQAFANQSTMAPPNPAQRRAERPPLGRGNTHFEQIVPVDHMGTWQQVDNEDSERRRARSVSAMALVGAEKLRYRAKKVVKALR